jgi:hypothetical protein
MTHLDPVLGSRCNEEQRMDTLVDFKEMPRKVQLGCVALHNFGLEDKKRRCGSVLMDIFSR